MRSNSRVLFLPLLVGHAVAFFKVSARAKCPIAGAGKHDTPSLRRRRVDRVEEGQEVAAHLGVQRIRHLRAVQSQQNQPVATILGP